MSSLFLSDSYIDTRNHFLFELLWLVTSHKNSFVQTLSKSARSESSSQRLLIICWNSASFEGLQSPFPSMIVALKAVIAKRENKFNHHKLQHFLNILSEHTHAVEILLIEESIVINIWGWKEWWKDFFYHSEDTLGWKMMCWKEDEELWVLNYVPFMIGNNVEKTELCSKKKEMMNNAKNKRRFHSVSTHF